MTVVFVIITALHVIAGELAPKGVALQYPERVALAVAGPLRLFRALFRPVIWLLNESGWLVARAVGVSADVGEERHLGAAELLRAIEASTEAGELKDEDRFLMARVLRFRNLTAEQVMVPRTELLALPVETSSAEALRFVAESHHSVAIPSRHVPADATIGAWVDHHRSSPVRPTRTAMSATLTS